MSWPKKTYKNGEWVDFKTPGRGAPEGFPDDWKKHKSSVDNSNYWDVINNPLYEAAANASGLDWDQWVEDSFAAIGEEDDYAFGENDNSMWGRIRENMGHAKFNELEQKLKDEGIDLTSQPDLVIARMPELKGYIDTKDVFSMAHGSGSGSIGSVANLPGNVAGILAGDGEPTPYSWGINRSVHGAVAEDLDTMQEWLTKTIKTHSLQDAPIINRGPEGSDYGIDGDIWEHYGLDQPVLVPKEMDIDYEFNLVESKPSNVGYVTPAGYPSLNVPEDTYKEISYDDMKAEGKGTYYDTWMEQRKLENEEARTAAEDTSYGEVKGKDKWIKNVQGIVGKDQNVSDWAKVAGVNNLNSRNDSDKIKTVFREHGGVLPT